MRFKLFVSVMFTCLFIGRVSAASFDCQKAHTKMEKLICSDEALSILDDELNKAFKTIIDKIQHKAVIRTWQKKWLSSYSLNRCDDVSCLKDEFTSRIVLLRQVAVDGQNIMRNGTYKLYYQGKPAREGSWLTVIALKENSFNVTGEAFWYGSNWKNGQIHMGEIAGDGTFDGKYVVVGQGGDECQIKFRWVGKDKLNVIADNLKCGGLNVSFLGEYVKAR